MSRTVSATAKLSEGVSALTTLIPAAILSIPSVVEMWSYNWGPQQSEAGGLAMYLWYAVALTPLAIFVAMKLVPSQFRSDSRLNVGLRVTLAMLPFVLVFSWYIWQAYSLRVIAASDVDHATASTKLMPTLSEMWESFRLSAFVADRNGHYQLWEDTYASFMRFTISMGIVTVAGVMIGLYMGVFPIAESLLLRFVVFWDKVAPLLLLPLLFIQLGVGETSKIALIVVGVLPGIILDAYNRVKEIPREQFYKTQTLGAEEHEIPLRRVLPQITPKMLDTLRLSFKAAWCYVIAGESVQASAGIGYRIYLLRRNSDMATIIPYVIWATVIMFALDYLVRWCQLRFKWVDK